MRLEAPLDQVAEVVFEIHRDLHAAELRADASSFSRLTTDEWYFVDTAGQRVEKSQRLKSLILPRTASRLQDEIRLRHYGDIAIMTMRVVPIGSTPLRATLVWTREQGQWRQAAVQQTAIGVPASVK
jgi:ketosteroid isomerase-like protein